MPTLAWDFDLSAFKRGVLSGEAGMLARPPGGLIDGYMMLIREGDGEGARDERALDNLDTGLMSQFWRSSSNSDFDGPPTESSEQNKGGKISFLEALITCIIIAGIE